MSKIPMGHKPVLLNEVLANIVLEPKDYFIDATLGAAGHSLAICGKYPGVSIIGFDLDPQARQIAEEKLNKAGCNFRIISQNFKELEMAGARNVGAILFDLGLSSMELQNSGRGFSFLRDEPLIMTFGEPKDYIFTAKDIVNDWSEENLKAILFGFGEERYAAKIAKAITRAREGKPIATTFDLVAIIASAVPGNYKRGRLHYATKTFQALRIAVNDELKTLSASLPKAFDLLKTGGRMLVISFHSLEDRIVKHFFQAKKKEEKAFLLTKKPIIATAEEIRENPRSRSAKLRILEKI